VQAATGDTVEIAFVDQGSTGEELAADASGHGIRLEVVKLPGAKRGFVLLPRRWVVERSFVWVARFRRLARDNERLPETVAACIFSPLRAICSTSSPEVQNRLYEGRATLEPLLELAVVGTKERIAVIGGGARNDFLVRVKASVMNSTQRILDVEEATALGAAILGGLGAGVYRDLADAPATVRVDVKQIEPMAGTAAHYDVYFREVYRQLYAALRSINHRIHDLAVGNDVEVVS
jgi:hypothetical protein